MGSERLEAKLTRHRGARRHPDETSSKRSDCFSVHIHTDLHAAPKLRTQVRAARSGRARALLLFVQPSTGLSLPVLPQTGIMGLA